MEFLKILPGSPISLGATFVDGGVNFCVFSRNAKAVFLELFKNSDDGVPFKTIQLDEETNRTGDLWHVFVAGLKPGALYLFRVDGDFAPEKGLRFDKNNYLYDPCAKALTDGSLFKNYVPLRGCPLEKMPKCVVVDDSYNWHGDKPLKIPQNKSIIYEMHLKGFTASENSKCKYAGTYRGLVEKIPYLKELGITAVEMLPIQEFDEFENLNTNPKTGEKLVNFWGYSTVAFFAPKASYAHDKTPGGCVREFKDMVRALHSAGIEVILDVVFNHTAEGNEKGVTLNFRGFDNSVYYHLLSEHPEYYANFSGCGNSLNCSHPVVQDYIVECLKYWVLQMHVDGFRFDLASVLTRDERGFVNFDAPLTRRISEDPVLRYTKIIAEPWDCGGAYHVGNFPGGRWSEWNDKFRDGIRKFIRGDEALSTEAATRLSGSSDLYSLSGRRPANSINFVTSHDGFTLYDLVSFNNKHNEQNGEENRDGNDNNLSYNNGFEGICVNPKIEKTRLRQIKNFFVALLVSQGTPMFVAGDEVKRTQGGNNNAYCQDNAISYFDWQLVKSNSDLFEFVKKLIALRKNHSVFSRQEFFKGQKIHEVTELPDISWHGIEGANPDWNKMNRFLAFRLGGEKLLDSKDDAKEKKSKRQECHNDFYIAFNTDIHDQTVTIPACSTDKKWYRVVDTSIDSSLAIMSEGHEEKLNRQDKYVLVAGSAIILMSK